MAVTKEQFTEEDAARLAKLDAGIKKLSTEAEELKDKAKRVFKDIKGTRVIGNVVIELTPQRKFNLDKAIEAFPKEDYPDKWVTSFDPAKLDKTQKDQFMEPNGSRLSVAVVKKS